MELKKIFHVLSEGSPLKLLLCFTFPSRTSNIWTREVLRHSKMKIHGLITSQRTQEQNLINKRIEAKSRTEKVEEEIMESNIKGVRREQDTEQTVYQWRQL